MGRLECQDIVESVRIDGKVVRRRLGTLGQRPPHHRTPHQDPEQPQVRSLSRLRGDSRPAPLPPRRDQYRQQRRHDRVFVLEINHPGLTTAEIVQSYRQLMEVERAFRVLKSLVKVRPVYHRRDRRVETHIFICFLAYLVAKVLEQHLRQAGITLSVAHALETLKRLQAVEHTWEDQAVVVKATKPDPEAAKILAALGLRIDNPVRQVTRLAS